MGYRRNRTCPYMRDVVHNRKPKIVQDAENMLDVTGDMLLWSTGSVRGKKKKARSAKTRIVTLTQNDSVTKSPLSRPCAPMFLIVMQKAVPNFCAPTVSFIFSCGLIPDYEPLTPQEWHTMKTAVDALDIRPNRTVYHLENSNVFIWPAGSYN